MINLGRDEDDLMEQIRGAGDAITQIEADMAQEKVIEKINEDSFNEIKKRNEDKVKKYLERIKKENGKVNAILHINENALAEAKVIDSKSKKGALFQLAGTGVFLSICQASRLSAKG